MKAAFLEEEFATVGVQRDGSLLLGLRDAVALVNRAADEGVPIVAVRGYSLTDSSASPLPEHRADFSARVARGHGCWQEAEAFLRTRAHIGLAFALTLGDDPIEAV